MSVTPVLGPAATTGNRPFVVMVVLVLGRVVAVMPRVMVV